MTKDNEGMGQTLPFRGARGVGTDALFMVATTVDNCGECSAFVCPAVVDTLPIADAHPLPVYRCQLVAEEIAH